MHIQHGTYKGKKLASPPEARLVQGRVKKAIFEILRDFLPGTKVLDLFAGSGVLGLESVSLGAQEVIFVDSAKESCSAVRRNIAALGIGESAELVEYDAFEAIADFARQKRLFDLVFVDPPYYQGLVRKSLQYLNEYDIVATSSFVVCFCFVKDTAEYQDVPQEGWETVFSRRYGDTQVLIVKH